MVEELQVLIEAARAGDRAARDALVLRMRPRLEEVLRFRLSRLESPGVEVEDLVQETWLRAFADFERFEWRGEGSLERWLAGIAVNLAREAESRAGRRRFEALDRDPPGAAEPPSAALRREERFDRLEAALATLSPEHRRALLLVRVDGLPVAEAAKKLGRSPNAVSNLLLRAARALRQAFGDTASLRLPDRRLRDFGDSDGPDDA